MKLRTVYLRITSFVGSVPGATHYYGSLWMGKQSVDIEAPITKEEANWRNRRDSSYIWREGAISTALPSEEQVREEGTKLARARWGDHILLLEGYHDCAGPMPVLWCPDDNFRQKLVHVYWKTRDEGADEDEIWEAHREWNQIMGEFVALVEQHHESGTDLPFATWKQAEDEKKRLVAEEKAKAREIQRAREREIRGARNREVWEKGLRFNITVPVVNPWLADPDGGGHGFLTFKMFVTEVIQGEEAVGTIGGGMGFVTIGYQGKEWMISHEDLWNAFIASLREAGLDKEQKDEQ